MFLRRLITLCLTLLLILPAPQSVSIQPPRDLPQVAFDVALDYAAHRLVATQHVTLTNTFGVPLNSIMFNVPAAHTPGVFDLQQVTLADQSADYAFSGTALSVQLPIDLQPARSISLTLKFSVDVPALGNDVTSFAAANLAYTADALNIGYWYPLLAPYRSGTGWLEVPWQPIGDPFASDVADYTATITATPGVTVVGGGTLNQRGNVWRYDLPHARTFGLLASPRYREATVALNGVTYSFYTFPEHTSLATIGLQTMVRAHALFSAINGPYPYSTLRVAEVSGPWSMEFSGFCALGATDIGDYDGTTRNRLIRIMAHEVSHQWWYGVVGDDQVREPWLDEGFARFNELRYYEAYSPQDAAWWWSSVIGALRNPLPLNSATGHFRDHRTYLISIYNQDAYFLNDLRQTMGRTTFDAFVRDLYQRNAYHLLTTQDFFEVLGDHTGVNVLGLRRRYFR